MMKLSVRKKVANGLVLFLLAPRMAATADELATQYKEGFEAFTAKDDFDLNTGKSSSAEAKIKGASSKSDDPSGGDPSGGDPSGGDPSGGDPSGGDPSGGDPSGGDPSGYDPSAFDPSGFDPSGGDPSGCEVLSSPPTLNIEAPRLLVTAENGMGDQFELSMAPDPVITRKYSIVSTDPSEAKPVPNSIEMGDNACIPQPVWVIGQNDYLVDGDIDYEIEIYDEQNFLVHTIKGVNLDNDNYVGVAVDVLGPNAIPEGDEGTFLVRVANVSGEDIRRNTLMIEASENLDVLDYAATLLSGDKLKSKVRMDDNTLSMKGVALAASDVLIVSLRVEMAFSSPQDQSITARFVKDGTDLHVDDDQRIRTSLP